MSKRKSEEDEPDPEGPWANKQFHPTKSSYSRYRRDLLRAASVNPVGGPPLAKSELRGPMEQFGVYIQLRDPKPLLELVRNYPFKDYQLEILLAQALHANLLEVVGQILEKMPALLTEKLAEYSVRAREVSVLSMSFIVTLLAEKSSTTVEQTAQGVLKQLGQDQLILDHAKTNKLKELARQGVPADEPVEEKNRRRFENGEQRPVFEHEIERGQIFHVQFSPDGRYLALANFSPEISVFDWRKNQLERKLDFSIGGGDVTMFTFSPDGQTVYAACHEDRKIMACRMDEQKADRNLDVDNWNYPYCMAVTHDGKLLSVGCERSTVIVVDTAKWSLVKRIVLPDYSAVSSLCFSLDDRQLFATVGNESKVYALDVATWDRRDLARVRHDVHSMVCSPVKPLLVGIGRYANFFWSCNYETGETKEIELGVPGMFFTRANVKFAGDGKYVIIVSRSGDVVVFDTENEWKQVYYVETDHGAFSLDVLNSPVGIIATNNNNTACVFDVKGIGRAQESLASALASGLSNWGQPQSPWDVTLTRGLYDPRLFGYINAFLTGARHC